MIYVVEGGERGGTQTRRKTFGEAERLEISGRDDERQNSWWRAFLYLFLSTT